MKCKALLAVAPLAALLACGAPGPPLPPSLGLPKPVQDLRASRKGDKVLLVWSLPRETTDGQAIRHIGVTRICRGTKPGMTECRQPVGEVPTGKLAGGVEAKGKKKPVAAGPAPQVTYTDSLPSELQTQQPLGSVTYAVETLNARGRSAGLSNQVEVPLAPTLPPPNDFRAQLTADGIVLTWSGVLHEHEAPELAHKYRVYRSQEGGPGPMAIAEVTLHTEPQAKVVDKTFEWEKTYSYFVTVVTVVSQPGKPPLEVEGENSPTIKVVAHDIFPPAVPSGLQAVFSGIGQKPFVDLTWAPGTDADLAGYNVYRREDEGEWTRLNTELLKAPSYRDLNVVPGHTYQYAVSAVDLRGNESARSEPATEAVPAAQ